MQRSKYKKLEEQTKANGRLKSNRNTSKHNDRQSIHPEGVRGQTEYPSPPYRLIEHEAGAADEKTTNKCEPKRRGNPVAGIPTPEKTQEGERERTTA